MEALLARRAEATAGMSTLGAAGLEFGEGETLVRIGIQVRTGRIEIFPPR